MNRDGNAFGHKSLCTPLCKLRAVSSPLERERPPMVACPACAAPAGVACTVRGPHHHRNLTIFGRAHPSRLEAA